MGVWHKTGCVLCAQNCGLEVFVDNNRMTRVRPDRSNPRSRGYVCRKGLNVIYHQYPADRLTQPLKRAGGRFEPISWERAVDEIAEKMRRVVDPPGQCLEACQIFTRLADKLGLIPEIPGALARAAADDRLTFGAKLVEWAGTWTRMPTP